MIYKLTIDECLDGRGWYICIDAAGTYYLDSNGSRSKGVYIDDGATCFWKTKQEANDFYSKGKYSEF